MKEKTLRLKTAFRAVMLILMLGSVGIMNVYAYDFSAVCETGQTLYYNINSIGVTVTYPSSDEEDPWYGYSKPSGTMIIPNEVSYNNVVYSVTSIGYEAFYCCSGLTSLTIPNSVTGIGGYAFSGCSGLTSLTISNSVTSIGDYAFDGCNHLTSLTIPNSVTRIGDWAFSECYNLKSLTIGDSVTYIGSGAFYYCSGLTSLTIPNSVISIGPHAFHNCRGFASLTIPNSVTYIGVNAFEGCSHLTSLEISNSITSINGYVFSGCSGLTSLTIPNSVTSIGGYAFSGCSGLTSLTIPNSVTSIGGNAFSGCSGLISLTIPDSVTNIGMYAFSGCSGLTSLTIPNSITEIRSYVFSGCSGLTSLTLPNSVTSIGGFTFEECSGLTSLTIPNSVTYIGQGAFSGCSGLTLVNYMGDIAQWCNISFSTTGSNPLYYSNNLYINNMLITDLIIPGTVTQVKEYAFSGCSGLTSLIIPNSVTSIGNYAFSGCSGLTSIDVHTSTPPTIKSSTFNLISNSIPISIPCGTLDAYQSAQYWNQFTNYQENCSSYEIIVSANLSYAGSVDGAGTYEEGTICTLTATAGNDYYFVNWTKNNVEVSTNAEYSFTVTEDAEYVANFEEKVIHDWYDNLIYTVNEDKTTVTLTGHMYAEFGQNCPECPDVTIVIPPTITNDNYTYTVTGVGDDVFMGFTNLVSVSIPNTVTTIKSRAFYECTGLKTITIPVSVTSIESYAFAYCSRLKNIIVLAMTPPSGGGYGSFYGVSNSIPVLVPTGTLENYSFEFCDWSWFADIREDEIISFADENVKSLCITNWDTNGDGELYLSESFTVIDLNNNYGGLVFEGQNFSSFDEFQYFMGLDAIEQSAFRNCTHLTSITIPNSVNIITNRAFMNCGTLTSVTIPSSVSSIGWYAFGNCSGLTSITVLAENPTSLENSDAFENVSNDMVIYVPCESLDTYKTATNWSDYANKMQCWMEQEITGYGNSTSSDKWAFIASPLEDDIAPEDIDGLVATTSADFDLYQLNPAATNEWENWKQTGDHYHFNLVNGRGYLYANRNDVNIILQGDMFTGDYKDVTLQTGWNLVGNPYAQLAYINRSYYKMNAAGDDIEAVSAYTTTAIPVCTGVVVQGASNADVVRFTKTAPSKSTGNGGLQMTLVKAGNRGNEVQDKAIVIFEENVQLGKYIFNENHAKLYIPQNGNDYAIAYSDGQSEIPLYFRTKEMGTYTINFNNDTEFGNVYLVDKCEGAVIDLSVCSSYTFIGSSADRPDRFELVFGSATGSETDSFVYQSGTEIIVNGDGELQVFDVMGRMVAKQYVNGIEMIAKPSVNGVYIFRLNEKTQKIVVK